MVARFGQAQGTAPTTQFIRDPPYFSGLRIALSLRRLGINAKKLLPYTPFHASFFGLYPTPYHVRKGKFKGYRILANGVA